MDNLAQRAKLEGRDLNNLDKKELFELARKELDQLREKAPLEAHQFVAILNAYKTGNAQRFNEAVEEFRAATIDRVSPKELNKVRIETFFNRVSPFYIGMIYFVFTFLFACLGWIMVGSKPDLADVFFKSAAALAAWTFAIQAIALIGRMYLMDRPFVFVTNLYSSAVFIALCGAAMGLAIEAIYGRGIGTAISSVIGGAGLLVAYFLDLGMEGDKLEMMQAVLDTNFWLATHVTTVTFGYAATFVAGFIGVAYILLAVFTKLLTPSLGQMLSKLIYGVVCFATLLSFVGTVLGGIWADYSWGRFWGWDPKENGAMLIVLWNALVLHARWAGLIKQHGLAVMAVFGNIVTAWSWFGTNQLGVGLHEYGFSSAVATSMVAFDFIMLGVIILGIIPKSMWLSSQSPATPRSKSPSDRDVKAR
jgi:ABC-type transport system involved in cytochrome c biogenesis permease subunit